MAKTLEPVSENAEDILALIDKEDVNYLGKKEVWAEDWDLYTLKEYKPEDVGEKAYTSPRPRNDFDKIHHAQITSKLAFQVRGAGSDEEKRRKATAMENLIYGGIVQANRRLDSRGEPKLKNGNAFLSEMRGRTSSVCNLFKGDDGEIVFDIRTQDPIHSRFRSGPDGLLWRSQEYPMTKGEAKILYPDLVDVVTEEESGQPTTVVDFYDSVNNCQILRLSSKFIKEPEPHRVGHVPCRMGFVGDMPTIHLDEFGSTVDARGDSVWAKTRKIYGPRNEIVSNEWTKAEKGNKAPLVIWTQDGRQILEDGENPYTAGTILTLKILPNGTKEDIDTLPLPETAKSTELVLGLVNTDINESGNMSPEAYMGVNREVSGAALHIVREERSSSYGPFTNENKSFFQWIAEEILHQFKKKGFETTLYGYKGAEVEENYFEATITPDDIDLSLQVEVIFEPKLPRDELNEVTMAQALTTAGPDGERLAPYGWTREEVMNVDNLQGFTSELQKEELERLPVNKLLKIIEPHIEDKNFENALLMCITYPDQQAGEGVAKRYNLIAKVREINPNSELLPPEPQPMQQGAGQGGTVPPQIPPEIMIQVEQMVAQGMPPEQIAQQLAATGAPPEAIEMIMQTIMQGAR